LHNVKNALAAATAAYVLGVPCDEIADGLHLYSGVAGRLQRMTLPGGDVVLDDSYNANLESAQAALSVLGTAAGQKFFVIGDMGELGAAARTMHADIGEFARRAGIDRLFALGELTVQTVRNFGDGATHYSDIDELIADLNSELTGSATVLVKGSRFMRMERVVKALTGELVPESGGKS
jgi:UDP-N-acetylmuramoyl-tripeptide--D-alanyl-D-alanine ligase